MIFSDKDKKHAYCIDMFYWIGFWALDDSTRKKC